MSDNTVELTRVEELLGDLVKSLNEQPTIDPTTEAIAKGADALFAEAKASNENIAKSLEALASVVASISERIDALSETVHTKIEKSLTDIASQPQPRAVSVVPETAPNEAVAPVVALSKDDVLSKALTELKTANGERKLQLLNGVARLDSNFAPAEVAAELNLR